MIHVLCLSLSLQVREAFLGNVEQLLHAPDTQLVALKAPIRRSCVITRQPTHDRTHSTGTHTATSTTISKVFVLSNPNDDTASIAGEETPKHAPWGCSTSSGSVIAAHRRS